MAQYIDKEKLATELSIYISNYKKMLAKMNRANIRWTESTAILEGKIDVLQHLLIICDNLEVKEVESTDTFIEKVENYLNSKLYDWVSIKNPDRRDCANVILKEDFIENFKNYMKRE